METKSGTILVSKTDGRRPIKLVARPESRPARARDQPGGQGEDQVEAPLREERAQALTQAFRQRLEEFQSRRAGPVHCIRLNRELFETRIGGAKASGRRSVTEDYVDRAKRLGTFGDG